MKFSSETLMAYADGELDEPTRGEIEAAMHEDAEIATQVAQHQSLRAELAAAFDDVLDEPIPERLEETVREAPIAAVATATDMTSARPAHAPEKKSAWSLPQWTAIAVSLVLGVVIGRAAFNKTDSDAVVTKDGHVIASGTLAAALSNQVGASPAQQRDSQIGISYRAKSGEYCRTFNVREHQAGNTLAGVACKSADEWRVQALAQAVVAAPHQYRMASTVVPPLILRAVEENIQGGPLDAKQEAAAREKEWK
jgi:hypothetical protein